jgi:hypothetical protein
MPTSTVYDWGQAVMTSMAAALTLFLGAIPKIIGFLAILIIGWLIAALLARATASLLRAVKFNDLAQRSGFSTFSVSSCITWGSIPMPALWSPTPCAGSCG